MKVRNFNKMKANTERKLIHKLYGLIAMIVLTCIIAAGFIYAYSSNVSEQSTTLEGTASLQQDFSELVNHLNQTSIIYYQLATSGYNQDQIDQVEQSLVDAREIFNTLSSGINEGEPLYHYFQHLDDAITAYQNIFEQNFTAVFVGDEAERVRSRVVPVITRNEESINSVNERIQTSLAGQRDDVSDALQQSLSNSEFVIMLALAVLIIVPLISLMIFAKNLNSGVGLVMKRIKAYHDGDLSYHHDTKRKDEFAEIDGRLANMGDQLQSILMKNKQISKDVLNVVQSASEKSAKQFKGMREIEDMMEQFSVEMERQTDFTGTISATTEEVSASSGEIQTSIGYMSEQLGELEHVSNHGLDLMNNLESSMAALTNQTSTTAERVTTIEEYLEHITSFIKGIDDIADQTNLLAINASIEAAKAGQEGKSFAVVADEIRKLSQGTNDFSKQTKDVLVELSQEVEQVVRAFLQFKSHSMESLEKTGESADLFKRISDDNSKITREHQDINKSIQQINRAIEEVVESVTELVNGASVLQERSLNVTSIIEAQTERQELLSNEVISLEETAQKLNH
ncbi:methyl-accepting chemotaxis protein [Amphibacillus jilinensis]|uniref:methyl-accepting chemotaxis protein n=1 Tax=Amphibacillus jilinensis TaxID=1216008 RepID=UPI001F49E8AE|nr:methyl-accepting chemotaxis protein [Amphibacillus jilinensis]